MVASKKVLFDVSPIFRQTQIWCWTTWGQRAPPTSCQVRLGLRSVGKHQLLHWFCMHPHFPTDPSHLPKLPQKFIKTCWVMSCHCTAYAKIHHKQIAIVQRGNKQNLGVPLATIYHHLSHSNFHVFFTSKSHISTIFLHKKPQKI